MSQHLELYNTLSGQLEKFEPLNAPFVGMYLCGPTVYGDPHLGHSRGAVFMDVLFRYLNHTGYQVRYVRNITDVGHLLNDSDDGEDKIGKIARLNKIEPMEVVQKYTLAYHNAIRKLNVIPPSIEPRASGHIQEQIDMIEKIISNGYAYEVNGSVYFDVLTYADKQDYGELSGRKIEDLIAGAGSERRTLDGQNDKKNPNDFALWKKASDEHIMKWKSPWSEGFPGWHIECSAMSSKYLGNQFDIHVGGMDLLFPHHESEIAQSKACNHLTPAKYWVHHNMITMNGQKMAKSLNNGILIEELFTGDHPLLEQAYSPMTLRFFLMQAHYRSTLDFSNEALKAAEKGYKRLSDAYLKASSIEASKSNGIPISEWKANLYELMNQDIATPQVVAKLFDASKWINEITSGKAAVDEAEREELVSTFSLFYSEILGLEPPSSAGSDKLEGVMNLMLEVRNHAKENKDWETADKIRDQLNELGIEIMDGKDGSSYKVK